jgi:hypothetical protein
MLSKRTQRINRMMSYHQRARQELTPSAIYVPGQDPQKWSQDAFDRWGYHNAKAEGLAKLVWVSGLRDAGIIVV